MKIKVRRARVSDIRQLQDRLFEFCEIQKKIGCKDIAKNADVLWGGIAIEIGNGFNNPNWMCVVAVKDEKLIAFMIGILEFCAPTSEDLKCVRIHANFLDEDSLVGPRIIISMWGMINSWAKEAGAGYFYANIHPGNQPSVRSAKKIGFKHHYTQFYRPVILDETEE